METSWALDALFAGIALGVLGAMGTPKRMLWLRIAILGAFPLLALLMRSAGPIRATPSMGMDLSQAHTWPYIVGRGLELLLALAISFPTEWAVRWIKPR
jgi:hypothetical protein